MIVSPFQSIVYQVFPACASAEGQLGTLSMDSNRPGKPGLMIAVASPRTPKDHKFVALRLNKSNASTIKVTMTYIQSRSSAKAKTENATRATGVAIRIKIPS
jgi:hypothetical protein